MSDPVLPPDPTFVDEIEALAAKASAGRWFASPPPDIAVARGQAIVYTVKMEPADVVLLARVPEMVSALRAQAETIDTLTRLVEDAERLIRREVPSGRWPMFWFSNVKRARALTEGKTPNA